MDTIQYIAPNDIYMEPKCQLPHCNVTRQHVERVEIELLMIRESILKILLQKKEEIKESKTYYNFLFFYNNWITQIYVYVYLSDRLSDQIFNIKDHKSQKPPETIIVEDKTKKDLQQHHHYPDKHKKKT